MKNWPAYNPKSTTAYETHIRISLSLTQVERFFVLKMSKNAGRANPDAGNQEAGELA
jgi:hypothetical protein